MILTKAIHISNHAIVLLNKDINSFKLDPTNDCILTSGKFNKLLPPNDKKGCNEKLYIVRFTI